MTTLGIFRKLARGPSVSPGTRDVGKCELLPRRGRFGVLSQLIEVPRLHRFFELAPLLRQVPQFARRAVQSHLVVCGHALHGMATDLVEISDPLRTIGMHDVTVAIAVIAGAAEIVTVVRPKRVQRPLVRMACVVVVPVVHAPAVVDAAPPIVMFVIHVQRRIPVMSPVIVVARDVVPLPIHRARSSRRKYKMVAVRQHEQVQQQRFAADPAGRAIMKSGVQIDGGRK